MSEIGPAHGKPESDIYTALLMVSAVFLLVGTILLCVRAQQHFGSWLPFGL